MLFTIGCPLVQWQNCPSFMSTLLLGVLLLMDLQCPNSDPQEFFFGISNLKSCQPMRSRAHLTLLRVSMQYHRVHVTPPTASENSLDDLNAVCFYSAISNHLSYHPLRLQTLVCSGKCKHSVVACSTSLFFW